MFRPNRTCTINKRTGFDLYGQGTVSAAVTEPCAVVKMRTLATPTTVRSDSSASRGHGEEFITYNVFLLTAATTAAIEDKITISGVAMRLVDMHPRYNIAGELDHWECQGRLWS
jgi:hypothetical protein